MIQSANAKSKSASQTLGDAKSLASDAEMTANQAKDTAQKAQQVRLSPRNYCHHVLTRLRRVSVSVCLSVSVGQCVVLSLSCPNVA